jgi:putative membrane protein
MTSEPRRLHPAAALARALGNLRELALPIVGAAVLGGGGGGLDRGALFALAGVVLALVSGVLSWRTTTYRVVDGTLRRRSGIFSPDDQVIPLGRIQAVDTVRGPVQRLFGVVALNVQTPGGGRKAELELSALSTRAAQELREALGHPERAGLAGAPEAVPDTLRLGARGVVVAALTAPQFGILVPLLAGAQSVLPDAGDSGLPEPTSIQQVVAIVAALLAGAFLLSVLGAVIAFGGFELERDGDRLRVRRGILQRRTASVPLSRVDGVRIVEGLLRERLGLASLRLETAGLRGEDAAARTLFPLVRRRDVPDLLARFVPDLAGGVEALEPPPARSRQRYVVAPALTGAAAGAALAVVLPALWPAALAGLVLGAALGEARFRTAGVALEAGRVVLRTRRLARTTVLARRHRLQAQHLSVSPLQRRGDVATLGIVLGSGTSVAVRHLDATRGRAAFEALRPGR